MAFISTSAINFTWSRKIHCGAPLQLLFIYFEKIFESVNREYISILYVGGHSKRSREGREGF